MWYWYDTHRIDNDAALELFGIEIGDFLAIAALIVSALLFWFGYARTRKSEQIKIARDIMVRIETKTQKLMKIIEELMFKHQDTAAVEHVNKEKGGAFGSLAYPEEFVKLRECMESLHELLSEIEYFSHLVKSHEIDNKTTLKHFKPQVAFILSNYPSNPRIYQCLYTGNQSRTYFQNRVRLYTETD